MIRLKLQYACLLIIATLTSLYAGPGETELKTALEAVDNKAIRKALKAKPDLNAPLNEEGHAALHLYLRDHNEEAGAIHKAEIVELLIKQGADVTKKDAQGRTPFLIHACNPGGMAEADKIMHVLLKGGSDINATNLEGENAMVCAIGHGYINLMKDLIAAGIEANPVLKGGNSYMHLATDNLDNQYRQVNAKIVDYLVKLGSDVDRANDDGDTPLHLAIQRNNFAAARALAKYAVRIGLKNKEGKTPLEMVSEMSASASDKDDLIALLKKSTQRPKFVEVGKIFSVSGSDVDIVGAEAIKARNGQRLIVRTERGDYQVVAGAGMHTKLKAKASPAAAARIKKGDAVFVRGE